MDAQTKLQIATRNAVNPEKLRHLMRVPVAWLVFAIILPNLFMDLINTRIPWVSNSAEAFGILLWAAFMAYLFRQIRKERGLLAIILTGLGFLLLAESIRVVRDAGLLDLLPLDNPNRMFRPFENAFHGFGLAMIGTAFITAIIEMLITRHHLVAEQERLSQEIARREQVETALRENQLTLQTLSSAAWDAIIMMDNAGRICYWNPAAERILGYSTEEIMGQSLHDCLAPFVHRTGYEKGLDAWQSTGQGAVIGKTLGLKARRKDQTEIDIELSVSSVRISEQWHAVGILRDISERVRSEHLIAEQRAKMMLNTRLAALGTMAGGIAHEINNPLAIIAGAAEQLETLLRAESVDHARADRALEIIERHVDRIHRIVRGLKVLSRDDSQDPLTPVGIKGLVADTLELCQARFGAHGIALIVPEIDPALEIECRPTQFSQVLLNLLNNAHDAVEPLSEKWIRLDTRDEGTAVSIIVTDSGPGLPEDIRDKVFEPFFTTKDPGKGIGLGLSVSIRFLEAHHGELFLDTNCPNTRFIMRLPKQPS